VLAGLEATRRRYARRVTHEDLPSDTALMRDEVVRRARSGDRDAFDALVRTSTRRLYGIALRILRDRHLAEDMVQDSLVDAWRDLRALRDPTVFDAWVTRILVRNCHREAIRARSRAQVAAVAPEASEDPSSEIDERDRLERAFRRLKPDHRIVMVLRHYLGWEPTEIADALGVPAGTIRSRLHYALADLRATLEADARTRTTSTGRHRDE
jgi:RNA polymerase sigma-70 factor (ECF subfamily)